MFVALLHDPRTYLWFLAYLFCFHVLALPLPPTARTLAVPVVLVAGHVTEGDLSKFLWLFGWFLVGDVLAALRQPVPA